MAFDDRLKGYIEVNVRIEKFWEKYPNGRIHTELLGWTDDGTITMKAEVYKEMTDVFPSAVGHAYEIVGSTPVNKTSALENCETSVVGRALAIMGFEIKKGIASKEEVESAIAQQDAGVVAKPSAPQSVPTRPSTPVGSNLRAGPTTWKPTENQMKRLWAISTSKGLDSDKVHALSVQLTSKELNAINMADYKTICDKMESMEDSPF